MSSSMCAAAGARQYSPRQYHYHHLSGPARRAAVRRRWRRAINVVLFAVKMGRISEDQHWGTYVERTREGQRLLLECRDQNVPDSYFRAMPNKAFPPGWVLKSLPSEVRQQIETFAKNKIVRLLLPRARLQATRRHLQFLANGARKQFGELIEKPECLTRHSTFFAAWEPDLVADLLAASQVRVYPAGWWLTPCSKAPFEDANAFFILDGSVQGFESLVMYNRYDALTNVAAMGDPVVATGAPLQHQASISTTAPLSSVNVPTSTAVINAIAIARGRNEVIDATRAVLHTPLRRGYRAKTSNVTVLEIPFQTLRALSLRHITDAAVKSRNNASLKHLLQTSLTTQVGDVLPLHPTYLLQPQPRPATTIVGRKSAGPGGSSAARAGGAADLSSAAYYAQWDMAHLAAMISAARPRVAFRGDGGSLIISGGSGERLNELIIIMRGQVRCRVAAAAATTTTTTLFLTSSVMEEENEDEDANREGECVLGAGDTFGEDYLVFDDPCPFTLQCISPAVEFYVIPRQAFVANLTNTSAKQTEYGRAKRKREALMARTKPTQLLTRLVGSHNLLGGLPPRAVAAIVDAMSPCVVKVADRLSTVGDEMSILFAMVRGKINVLLVGSEAPPPPPTASGGGGSDLPLLPNATSLFGQTVAGVVGGGAPSSSLLLDLYPQRQSYVNEALVGDGYLLKRSKWRWSYSAQRLCEGWVITRQRTWAILRAYGCAHDVLEHIRDLKEDVLERHHMQLQQQQGTGGGGGIGASSSMARRNTAAFHSRPSTASAVGYRHGTDGGRGGTQHNRPSVFGASSGSTSTALHMTTQTVGARPPSAPPLGGRGEGSAYHGTHFAMDKRLEERRNKVAEREAVIEKQMQSEQRKLESMRARVRPPNISAITNRSDKTAANHRASRGGGTAVTAVADNDGIGIGRALQASSKLLYARARMERYGRQNQARQQKQQQQQYGLSEGGGAVSSSARRSRPSSAHPSASPAPFVQVSSCGGLDLIMPTPPPPSHPPAGGGKESSSAYSSSLLSAGSGNNKQQQQHRIDSRIEAHLRMQQRRREDEEEAAAAAILLNGGGPAASSAGEFVRTQSHSMLDHNAGSIRSGGSAGSSFALRNNHNNINATRTNTSVRFQHQQPHHHHHHRGIGAGVGWREPPTVSTAEKAVLREIVSDHASKIQQHRQMCVGASDVAELRRNNPHSSLHRRSTMIPRVTLFGELYYEAPQSRTSTRAANRHLHSDDDDVLFGGGTDEDYDYDDDEEEEGVDHCFHEGGDNGTTPLQTEGSTAACRSNRSGGGASPAASDSLLVPRPPPTASSNSRAVLNHFHGDRSSSPRDRGSRSFVPSAPIKMLATSYLSVHAFSASM